MDFTPLHRALGRQPSDLTNELLDEAIAQGLAETDDLDWKEEFPPSKGLSKTDVRKDIAAMANRGGGMIIYGVKEHQKKATGRAHIDGFDENYERTYRSVAITAITPPVFDLDIRELGENPRAVAVIVPPSVDGPHLIYNNDFFGAPIRNNADTAWMRESQIETMYKARFDERRRSDEALESLYAEIATGKNTEIRAWFIAVARPRIPTVAQRMAVDDARQIFDQAIRPLKSLPQSFVSPLERTIDRFNLRQGLRKWIAPSGVSFRGDWAEASAEIHYDGSVALAAGVGGFPNGQQSHWDVNQVDVRAVERDIAEFMCLLRAMADALGNDDYEVRIGIELSTPDDLMVLPCVYFPRLAATESGAVSLPTYTPVTASVNARTSDEDFYRQTYRIIEDCVNQCGISELTLLEPPRDADE